MTQYFENNKIIYQVKKYIEDGVTIVTVDCDAFKMSFINKLILYIQRQKAEQNFMILIYGHTKQASLLKDESYVKLLTQEEYYSIQRIFGMYEFSNHILMLYNSNLYPVLFNYIKIGIMTEEEVFEALLR